VGDISAQFAVTRPLLRHGPLRVLSFGEALGLAKARDRFEKAIDGAIDGRMASDFLHVGLSPHAPYTVDMPGYHQCVQLARQRQIPLCTHLAETIDEEQFLREQRGPFREIWEGLGTWADDVTTYDGSPVAFARAIGLLDVPALLAHVNYAGDDELAMLAAGRASVAFCPRTNAYFGHKPHRWREMLERGINVAVGTDSCASSPDLNLVDDLRLLWRRHGHAIDSDVLWRLATVNAAAALQWDSRIGSLTPGKLADLTAFSFIGDVDPLAAVLDDDTALPTATWIGGKRV
jgi:cytosine/adenosine deaminase-related metal-dependent hydrolase